ADLAGELGVGAGHEGGHLLMPHLHEVELVAGPVERADQAADAVAGVAEDPLDPPLMQPLPHEIADCLGHAVRSAALRPIARATPPRAARFACDGLQACHLSVAGHGPSCLSGGT